tara:strand:- start:733 stop:1041 length:309 start_codon:yes stop_codon:yes gene_type:complete
MKLINTKLEFEGYIKSGDVIMQFSADWCMPCKSLSKTLLTMVKVYPDIGFAKFDIDNDTSLAQKYDVRSVPTTIFFKDGKEATRMMGSHPSQKIVEQIKATF